MYQGLKEAEHCFLKSNFLEENVPRRGPGYEKTMKKNKHYG